MWFQYMVQIHKSLLPVRHPLQRTLKHHAQIHKVLSAFWLN